MQIGKAVACGLLGLVLCVGAGAVSAAEVIDRVLAVVAGNLITLSDVNAVRDLRLMATDEGADPIRVILPRLIDRALMLAEVDRYAPPEPPAAAIDRQVASVRARFSTNETFAFALARVGFDERHLRETLRQDLRLVAYLDQRFTVRPPTEEELQRYYREHPQRFTDNGRLMPFDESRSRVLDAATADLRQQLVDEWVASLRRRTDIIDLSSATR